ncbi:TRANSCRIPTION FACTOR PIF1-RELATED [Salix purpurea]|uniref:TRANSCRIPTION FACTOR PIF1-RELATED n=1 Tax=Salix purpurea TaxID=77065 RepID=A0A9Q0PG31_SALPP|nr:TRANSCRIPTION FACTOR PIF1-RELATED [Salix purpurea]
MNPYAPDFEMDDDYSLPPPPSTLNRPRKPAMQEEEIMELLWQNGQRTEPRSCLAVSAPRPPIAPVRRAEVMQNFAHFSRHRAANVSEPGPSNSRSVVRESTVVDSCETPKARTSETAFARSADNSVAVAGKGL